MTLNSYLFDGFTPIGVLVRLFWLETDGTGLGWFHSICQGHLLSKKNTSELAPKNKIELFFFDFLGHWLQLSAEFSPMFGKPEATDDAHPSAAAFGHPQLPQSDRDPWPGRYRHRGGGSMTRGIYIFRHEAAKFCGDAVP